MGSSDNGLSEGLLGRSNAEYRDQGSNHGSQSSLLTQDNTSNTSQRPHQAISQWFEDSTWPFAPEVNTEISVKTLLEPMSNHLFGHIQRRRVWDRFLRSSAMCGSTLGPFKLKLDNFFPSQILASPERLESLNKSFRTVRLTLD